MNTETASDTIRLWPGPQIVSYPRAHGCPESIHGGKVDVRSDLYGVWIVFYHMLTGTPPYKNATVTLMLEAHLHAAIPRLPRRTSALQPLIDGLLEKNPNERCQSAAEVLEGVEWLGTASACSEPA